MYTNIKRKDRRSSPQVFRNQIFLKLLYKRQLKLQGTKSLLKY